MKSEFYVTRDTESAIVKVWPAHIGIRKFEGCIAYGAGYYSTYASDDLGTYGLCMYLDLVDCKYIFGFVPKSGEAWLIEGNKKTKVDIEFTK